MRIVQVNLQRDWGGAERHVFLLSDGLRQQGQQVIVTGHPRGRLLAEARSAGIDCRAVTALNQMDLAAGLRLAARIARFRPQILHLHTPRDYVCGFITSRLLADVTLVLTRHMMLPLKPMMRTIYRKAAAVICLSDQVQAHLREQGIPSASLRRVRSGIDTDMYATESCLQRRKSYRHAWGVPPGGVAFGVVGRLVGGKGHGCLIDALSIAAASGLPPNAILVIVGEGPERPAVERQARAHGLLDRVHFAGFCTDMPGVLSALDVVVLPSQSELLPLSIIEAMASELPVIATTVGGIPELVEHEVTGLLVEPQAPRPLAQCLMRLAGSAPLRDLMGANGLKRARSQFTLPAMVTDTLAVYRSLLPD